MYLLYIDESENSYRRDEWTPKVFGLAGLLVTARYLTKFVDSFSAFKKQFNVPLDKEVKGCEIFNQNKWAGLSDDERRLFCTELSKAIVGKNSLAKGFFIYKPSELQKSDYLKCLCEIIQRSAKFVAQRGSTTSKQLLIIFDEKDEFEHDINKAILHIGISVSDSNKKVCRIIDHGFPGKSHLSEMLQMADFTGYILRLSKTLQRDDTIFAKGKDKRFVQFVDDLVLILNKKIQHIEL